MRVCGLQEAQAWHTHRLAGHLFKDDLRAHVSVNLVDGDDVIGRDLVLLAADVHDGKQAGGSRMLADPLRNHICEQHSMTQASEEVGQLAQCGWVGGAYVETRVGKRQRTTGRK